MNDSTLPGIEHIASTLARQGWCVTPDFVDTKTWHALAAEANQRWAQQEFHPAHIGIGQSRKANTAIRGDSIAWIEHDAPSVAQAAYITRLEHLRFAVNQELFLGAFDLELHFARYPAGAYYSKHLDQHAGTQTRMVSCILYLNQDWQDDDGGQLRIYTVPGDEGHYTDVIPAGGTLVTFLSGDFHHEVLPAQRPRLSIAGWMRTRSY